MGGGGILSVLEVTKVTLEGWAREGMVCELDSCVQSWRECSCHVVCKGRPKRVCVCVEVRMG